MDARTPVVAIAVAALSIATKKNQRRCKTEQTDSNNQTRRASTPDVLRPDMVVVRLRPSTDVSEEVSIPKSEKCTVYDSMYDSDESGLQ